MTSLLAGSGKLVLRLRHLFITKKAWLSVVSLQLSVILCYITLVYGHGPVFQALGCCRLPADGGQFPPVGGRGLPGKCLASALVRPSDKPHAAAWGFLPGVSGRRCLSAWNVLQWLFKREFAASACLRGVCWGRRLRMQTSSRLLGMIFLDFSLLYLHIE